MRDYQVHGLNWLIKLYDNCINGILADEMVNFLCFYHDCCMCSIETFSCVVCHEKLNRPKTTLKWVN